MKSFLLVLLLSSTAMATDYSCRTSRVQLDFKSDGLMSSLVVKDIQSGEFYFNGFVEEIESDATTTVFQFNTGHSRPIELQFKTAGINNEASTLLGLARGQYIGSMDQSLRCFKK